MLRDNKLQRAPAVYPYSPYSPYSKLQQYTLAVKMPPSAHMVHSGNRKRKQNTYRLGETYKGYKGYYTGYTGYTG